MEADSRKELDVALNYLESLSKKDDTQLKKTVYESLTALSYLVLEGKKAKFQRGWPRALVDRHGDPLFDMEESSTIETLMDTLIKPIFDTSVQTDESLQADKSSQTGGLPSLGPSSKKGFVSGPGLSSEDVNLDKAYMKIKNYLAGLDAQAHMFSRELGPFKFFYDAPTDIRVPIPIPPYAVPFPPRAVPVLIGAFVEVIRLTVSLNKMSNPIVRQILSVVLAIIDLLQGQWKQGLLSFAGVFGQYPMVVGIIGKLSLNAFSMISPDLQDKVLYDIFQSGKSMIAGVILWLFSTFAPDYTRLLVNKQFDMMNKLVENANGKIQIVQGSMQKSVDPMGIKLHFNEIPETMVPSFDDIQNLQSIAKQPAILCSKEFQDIVAPLKSTPPALLFLQLLNIPTDPESISLQCGTMAGVSLESTIEKTMTPQVTVPARGGKSRIRTYRRKTRKQR